MVQETDNTSAIYMQLCWVNGTTGINILFNLFIYLLYIYIYSAQIIRIIIFIFY